MAKDPNFASRSLILHFDGANGSTTFVDSSPNAHSVVAFGNAAISTAQSKFGGASCYFDGTGDYLVAPNSSLFSFGTLDFEIEFQLRPNNFSNEVSVADTRNSPSGPGLCVVLGTDGKPKLFSSGSFFLTGSVALSAGAWNHVKVASRAGVIDIYVDGQKSSSSYSSALNFTDSALTIGGVIDFRDTGANYKYAGFIDELRITKGFAQAAGNFTPPTAALPGAGDLSGVVEDASGAPAARLVRAIREDTGRFVGETTSNAATGAYSIPAAIDGPHTLITYPAAGENLPALALRGVVPA